MIKDYYSYKLCEYFGAVFQAMFPDRDIAKQLTCREKKAPYLGIAPHFLSLMKERVKNESRYVLLFDESLNREMRRCQLDING